MLHIFTHHIRKTEDQLREILRLYMLANLEWIQRISRVVLHDVNVTVEDYIDTITTAGVHLDFVAVLVFCRIYHMHMAIFNSK